MPDFLLKYLRRISMVMALLALPSFLFAQTGLIYGDLNALEGIPLHPENVLRYKIINNSGKTIPVRVQGTLSLKSRPVRLQYELTKTLYPGENTFSEGEKRSMAWTTSEPALKELFLTHGNLPQGTFEYCVDLQPQGGGSEQGAPEAESSCIYYTQDDLFAINLIDPEDKAVLYEKYPVFSWVTSYPFASELTYRIRVAEQKAGQNPANAIARNNAMWQDNGIAATNAIYPVTGKPLEYGQPYVWTVDAYYKGLLLGGAETWRFILAEDSLLKDIPRETHYVDIREEKGGSGLYAVGNLKLKYYLREMRRDNLSLRCTKKDGQEVKIPQSVAIKEGENRFEIDLKGVSGIRHLQKYRLDILDGSGNKYQFDFRYVNPDFL